MDDDIQCACIPNDSGKRFAQLRDLCEEIGAFNDFTSDVDCSCHRVPGKIALDPGNNKI